MARLNLKIIWLLAVVVTLGLTLAAGTGHAQEAPTADPHGTFTENVQACGSCHAAHAGFDATLLRWEGTPTAETGVDDVCLTCHDGTSSQAPVLADWATAVSRHQFDEEAYSCNSCHNPHIKAADKPELVSPPMAIQELDRDADGNLQEYFFNPDHSTTMASGTSPRDYQNYSLCFSCHRNFADFGKDSPFAGSGYDPADIFALYRGSEPGVDAGHYLKTTGGEKPVNWKLPCSDCHSPHGAPSVLNLRVAGLELDAGGNLTTASQRSFCLSCHQEGNSRYGISLNLPSAPAAHADETRGCSSCHGAEGNALKAAHAPQLPTVDGLTVVASGSPAPADGASQVTIQATPTYGGQALGAGREVAFAVTSGSVSLSAASATTDASGVASITVTASQAGTATITATVAGQSTPVEIEFTIQAG